MIFSGRDLVLSSEEKHIAGKEGMKPGITETWAELRSVLGLVL